ncbi:hypothetical protein LTR95_008123 [Oleoguttula sp. CCFEE 5521]
MDILPHHFRDQGRLLDIIDGLRSQGLNSYISLPQLVVCGDQSAGKSSVLEGISGVAFPTKDNLCTRFATEVVLRRDAKSTVHVTILPDATRPEAEKEELRAFRAPNSDLADLSELIDVAKDRMGLNSNAKAFSRDILRIELSGPDQPHLTLVDLPGLIHAESKHQSTQDVELVASLVRSYIANPRSIVLAVVSAKNDYANRIVTKLAREVDPKGLRTLGIITKPDTLHVGSESEAAYLDMARNENVQFRLGWHVLRNRDFDTKHSSREERDEAEKTFFSNGVWKTLPLHDLGVESLRPRLSKVLKEQIISELPQLIKDIELGLTDCRNVLQHLGDPRTTTSEQRLYLIRISEAFSSLLNAASDGVYDHDFFGDARTDSGFKKRLRAVVQSLLLEFAQVMRTDGHFEEISSDAEHSIDGHTATAVPASSRRTVGRSAYIEAVSDLITRTRCRELPGTFNPMIIGDLFLTQAQPWTNLVHEYVNQIIAAARNTIELILAHSADLTTAESLLREIINPAFEGCVEKLRRKIKEILRPHRRGHPITYNHYFTDTIQKARRDHSKKQQSKILQAFFAKRSRSLGYSPGPEEIDIEKLLEALNPALEGNMDRFACSEATYCMEAYYKVKEPIPSCSVTSTLKYLELTHSQVALKMLVDNVAGLGVESCLLEGLQSAFTAHTVMCLGDDVVQNIATELQESASERSRTQEKLRTLDNGLHILTRYRRSKQEGWETSAVDESTNIEQVFAVDNDAISILSDRTKNVGHQASHETASSTRTAEGNDPTSIPANRWNAFLPPEQPSPSKAKKKSVKNRAAVFDNEI